MNDEKVFQRQVDLVKPTELLFPITVIGCGGIGSWTSLFLAKMGAISLTLIDFDKVEAHNAPSQLYGPDDVGSHKVSALQQIISTFTGTTPIPFVGKVSEYAAKGLPFGRVVICAVDSLDERRKIWEIVKSLLAPGGIDLYIDARMGGEQLRIMCISPYNADSILKYEKKMENIKQKEDPTPCTGRSIVYGTGTVGTFVASRVKRFAKRQPIEFDEMFSMETLERV